MVIPKARKLKSGAWHIQLRLDGESISVTESTEKECIKVARHIKSEYLLGLRKKPSEMTLRQALKKYIKSRDNTLSPSTIRGYETIERTRFLSVMDVQIKDIKDWQSVCNDEAALCAPKTLKNAWGLVKSAIIYCGMQPPKVKLPQIPKKDHVWIDPEQLSLFMDAIRNKPCEIQAILALHGLRSSEILALTRDKIDLEKNLIIVSGAVVPDKTHKFVEKKTNKNATSQRTVPIIIPRLVELLKKYDASIPTMHSLSLRKQINSACESAKLPKVGIHGLRHSFASLCYHLGLSERETMQLGGWSDANTMRKIYIHLAQKDKENANQKLIGFFKNIYEKSE